MTHFATKDLPLPKIYLESESTVDYKLIISHINVGNEIRVYVLIPDSSLRPMALNMASRGYWSVARYNSGVYMIGFVILGTRDDTHYLYRHVARRQEVNNFLNFLISNGGVFSFY